VRERHLPFVFATQPVDDVSPTPSLRMRIEVVYLRTGVNSHCPSDRVGATSIRVLVGARSLQSMSKSGCYPLLRQVQAVW
jgi:hypothetical protein